MGIFCRFIELDEGETVESVRQHDIAQAVDISSAQKVSGRDVVSVSTSRSREAKVSQSRSWSGTIMVSGSVVLSLHCDSLTVQLTYLVQGGFTLDELLVLKYVYLLISGLYHIILLTISQSLGTSFEIDMGYMLSK